MFSTKEIKSSSAVLSNLTYKKVYNNKLKTGGQTVKFFNLKRIGLFDTVALTKEVAKNLGVSEDKVEVKRVYAPFNKKIMSLVVKLTS